MRRATAFGVGLLLGAAPSAAHAAPGDQDRRFGGRDGIVTSKRLEGGTAAVLDRGERILVAGGSLPGVARLTRTGRFDRAFGDRGVAATRRGGLTVPFGVRRDAAGAVHVLAASGSIDTPPVVLLGLTTGGRRPRTVVHDEVFLGPIAGGVVRPDGGAYVVSTTSFYGSNQDIGIRAVRADGTVDTAFGGGTVTICDAPGDLVCRTRGVARDGTGVAVSMTLDKKPSLVRVGADGIVRQTAALPFPAEAIAPRPDGSVLLAGGSDVTGRSTRLALVARLLPDGTLDRAYGVDGIARVGRASRRAGSIVHALVADASGRAYVASERWNQLRPVIARLTAAGRVDRRFSRDGITAPPRMRRGFNRDQAHGLLLDRRRGVILYGTRFIGGTHDAAYGCAVRDDTCTSEVRLAVWRFRT